MKSIASVILCLFLAGWSSTTAFQTPLPRRVVSTSGTALHVFGNKKTKAQQAAEAEKYWQGEWVCKDCGYIYNRVSRPTLTDKRHGINYGGVIVSLSQARNRTG